jgi:predicted transcriptional regulator
MDIPKTTDGELNVLNVLWRKGTATASEIVKELNREIGWNRNTTYTFINRLVDKGIVERSEPGFKCRAVYTREQVGASEAREFVDKMFGGSFKTMVASFLKGNYTEEEIAEVREMLDQFKTGGR